MVPDRAADAGAVRLPGPVRLGAAHDETFTWAVAHDGDLAAFQEAEAAYLTSPERAAAFATFPGHIAKKEIGFADDVLAH